MDIVEKLIVAAIVTLGEAYEDTHSLIIDVIRILIFGMQNRSSSDDKDKQRIFGFFRFFFIILIPQHPLQPQQYLHHLHRPPIHPSIIR